MIEAPLAGREAKRVGIERAGMNYSTIDDLLHGRRLAGEGGEWDAAADGLAENRQIRGEAEMLLRAAGTKTKAGDRLIGDHQHAFPVAELADRLDHSRHWLHAAGIAQDRLEDDRSDLAGKFRDAP